MDSMRDRYIGEMKKSCLAQCEKILKNQVKEITSASGEECVVVHSH